MKKQREHPYTVEDILQDNIDISHLPVHEVMFLSTETFFDMFPVHTKHVPRTVIDRIVGSITEENREMTLKEAIEMEYHAGTTFILIGLN